MAFLDNPNLSEASLTGWTRAALDDAEKAKGSLAQWLPGEKTDGMSYLYPVGFEGMTEEAAWRAFDAEPEIGKGSNRKWKTIRMQPLSQQQPVGEEQLAQWRRGVNNTNAEDEIRRLATQNATAISNAVERLRGSVLVTGKSKIVLPGGGFIEDDFGRDEDLTISASTKWSEPSAKVLDDLDSWVDLVKIKGHISPGTLLMSKRVWRALVAHIAKIAVPAGSSAIFTDDNARTVISNMELPEVVVYERFTAAGRVLPDNLLLILPAAGDTRLGVTKWGLTEAASRPEFQIEAGEQPGVVTAVISPTKIAEKTWVQSDAIALPVLTNPNACAAVTVL